MIKLINIEQKSEIPEFKDLQADNLLSINQALFEKITDGEKDASISPLGSEEF